VFGFAAAAIWASWSVVTRLAGTTSLDASDITALRFGLTGLLFSPVVTRRGLACDRLGWLGLGLLVVGVGAPYSLVAATGLRFAPAYDGGALNPGCMPLFVALMAAIAVGEKLSSARILGLSLISAGAVIIVGWHGEGRGTALRILRTFGDALFLIAAFLTACFTLVMRHAKLDALHATALASTGSLAIYLPIYVTSCGARLARYRSPTSRFRRSFRGRRDHHFDCAVRACSCHPRRFARRSLRCLGAGAVSAVCDRLLGEWPSETDWVGIVLISAGVYLTSGGP
jgi:drug/metabolite transporter (DMT)-like permease